VFRGYLNITGAAGTAITKTFGVFSADGQRTLIGGVLVSEGPYFTGQRYRAVTFPEPGVDPIEVQWSTNHETSFPPYEGLEVLIADGAVAGYSPREVPYMSPEPAPAGFALLAGPTMVPTLTGAATTSTLRDLDGDGIPDANEGNACRVLMSRDTDRDPWRCLPCGPVWLRKRRRLCTRSTLQPAHQPLRSCCGRRGRGRCICGG
jgi:hypothetical protein